MSLKTAIKRINLFSQGQRLIVIISVLIAILAMGVFYYTPYPLVVIPILIAINYFLFRRILVTTKARAIITKSLRPLLWVIISMFYFFTIYDITKTPPAVFLICMVFCALVYGLFCHLEIQAEPNIVLDNTLTVLFILVSTSFASLLTTYWRWPVVLVMLLLWAVNSLIALWWLLDFTSKPQILAAIWGLLVVELFWLASRWTILYQIPHIPLIISQFSAIITALAYGWGGIYYHYKKRTLKKSIVFEYLAVTIVVFVAVLLLNRWTSTG